MLEPPSAVYILSLRHVKCAVKVQQPVVSRMSHLHLPFCFDCSLHS